MAHHAHIEFLSVQAVDFSGLCGTNVHEFSSAVACSWGNRKFLINKHDKNFPSETLLLLLIKNNIEVRNFAKTNKRIERCKLNAL